MEMLPLRKLQLKDLIVEKFWTLYSYLFASCLKSFLSIFFQFVNFFNSFLILLFSNSFKKIYCIAVSSSLILSSIFTIFVFIRFYIRSKRFFLKCNQWRISVTKKLEGFTVYSSRISIKVFRANIWEIINWNLLKLLFVWNFHNRKMCTV